MKLQFLRAARALLLLSLIATLLPLSGGAKQVRAGGGWSVWLYNDETGALARVHPDGSVEEHGFPLPFGASTPPYSLAFSRDGNRMAFCLTDDAGVTSVRVYDIRDGLYRSIYMAPGMVQGCWLERYSFSEDGSQLAVGLFNHYPDPADPRPEWELLVIHAETGAVIYRRAARDPQIAALGLDISNTIPAVVRFEPHTPDSPGRIAFKPVQYGTEGMQEYHSLIYRLDDGSVRAEGYHGKGGFDLLLATGEIVFQDVFDWLPQGRLDGPGYLYNVVLYAAPDGEPYIVYHGGAAVLGNPTFIDGGRRLAVYRYAHPGPPVWYSVSRAGMVAPLPIAGAAYQVWGLPDGYIHLSNHGAPPAPAVLYQTRFLADGTSEIAELWRSAPGDLWRVVWVTPLLSAPDLPPFEPFALLGEPPVMVPTATAGSPGVTPTVSAPFELTIGGMALINTTEGDFLRVRNGPGMSFAVLFQLSNGTLVTVREGPLSGDGYSWWRIETGDGRAGWAVDGVPEAGGWLQTLVPVGG